MFSRGVWRDAESEWDQVDLPGWIGRGVVIINSSGVGEFAEVINH